MPRQFRNFLRLALFYAALFFMWRLLFLLFNRQGQESFLWSDALPAFSNGLRMDLSVVAYILILPLLFRIVTLFSNRLKMESLHAWYHFIVLVLLTIIALGNVMIYHFWGNMLNYRALTYLSDPRQILISLSTVQLLLMLGVLVVLLFVQLYSMKRLLRSGPFFVSPGSWKSSAAFVVAMTALLVLSIRGGWQMLPMNESLVYYSNIQFLNHTAINPVWHLANDVRMAGLEDKNPFERMPDEKAKAIVSELFAAHSDSFPRVLTEARPNIVLLILESYTADLVGAMGGEKGISPNLDTLIRQGLLFSEIYSSGARTDQGIVSLLNGWPATPFHSIMRSAEKSKQLPSMVSMLKQLGYATSFYYGGESNFSNMDVYCINQGFENVVDHDNFDSSVPQGKWGVHDEFVLHRQVEDLSKGRQPFFSVTMSLSNHEPFDVPGALHYPADGDANKFRNSAFYTDESIGKFFREARQQSWYPHTLFILVADHGHELPLHRNIAHPESRRIPLLFYGGVLDTAWCGKEIATLGGHHDLPATLLPQMGLRAESYSWSKNLLDTTVTPFAYFQVEHAVGWVEGDEWVGYSYSFSDFHLSSAKLPEERRAVLQTRAEAFVQRLYEAYRAY